MKDLLDHIVIDPEQRSGKPCVRGTRITVYDVLEYLAGGMSTDELLSEFPELTSDDVQAVLQFAAARERRLASSHGGTSMSPRPPHMDETRIQAPSMIAAGVA